MDLMLYVLGQCILKSTCIFISATLNFIIIHVPKYEIGKITSAGTTKDLNDLTPFDFQQYFSDFCGCQ